MSRSKFTPREQMVRALTTGKPKEKRDDVRDWADKLDEGDLHCRGVQHIWEDDGGEEIRPDLLILYFKCASCDNEKIMEYTPFGKREISRKYRDGYLAPKGTGRANAKAIHLISFNAALNMYKKKRGGKRG